MIEETLSGLPVSAPRPVRLLSPPTSIPLLHVSSDDSLDDDDDDIPVNCGSLRMMPSSLIALFRRAGRSMSLDSGDSRLKVGDRSPQTSPSSPEKVRNIYRKPQSRLTRPRSNSFGRLGTSDPDPTLASHPTTSRPADLLFSRSLSPEFRPRASSMPAVPPSILRNRQPALSPVARCQRQSRSPTNRHASFRKEVDVYYYDSTESLVQSEEDNSPRAPMTKIEEDDDQAMSPLSVDSRVIPVIHSTGGKGHRLCLTIRSEDGFVQERTKVKSLSRGKALIVEFSRDVIHADGSVVEVTSKQKLLLDVVVDAYHVKARVHSGELMVEAPVLEAKTDSR